MIEQITQEMIDNASAKAKDGFDSVIHDWILKPYSTKERQNGEQIIDSEGNPILDSEGNPTYEQIIVDVIKYRITGYTAKAVEVTPIPIFVIDSEQVTVNGNPTTGKEPVYYGLVDDSFTATANITDGQGNTISDITSTQPLRLPAVKIIDDGVVGDKTYMDASINAGQLTATGKFRFGGDWELQADRINAALDEIDAGWNIEMDDMKFLIAEKITL